MRDKIQDEIDYIKRLENPQCNGHQRAHGNPSISHQTINGIEKKNCSSCCSWKALSEFGSHKKMKDSLSPSCLACNREKSRNRKK